MPTTSLNFCRVLGAAGAPAVAPQGIGGAETWGYKIVGVDANGGTTAAGAEGTTAGGNATLTALNFNRITWADPVGCTSVRIYRTSVPGGGSPATLGLIGTVAAGVQTFDDTGIAGDATVAPTSDTTGLGSSTATPPSYVNKWVGMGGTFTATLQVQGLIGTNWVNVGSALTAPGFVEVAPAVCAVRVRNTAYTSGTPELQLLYLTVGRSV